MTDENENKCPRCGGRMTGRHCLAVGCGFSRTDASRPIKVHDKPEPEDGQTLINLMAEHSLTFPKNAIEWRLGKNHGTLPTLNLSCRCLCTDGIVAWFLLDDGTVFFGHVANFKADPKEGSGGPREKKLTKRQQMMADL